MLAPRLQLSHNDNGKRCAKWASFWSQECRDVDHSDVGEVALCEADSIAPAAEEVFARIKSLAVKLVRQEHAPSGADDCSKLADRMAQIEAEIGKLDDLSADKYVEQKGGMRTTSCGLAEILCLTSRSVYMTVDSTLVTIHGKIIELKDTIDNKLTETQESQHERVRRSVHDFFAAFKDGNNSEVAKLLQQLFNDMIVLQADVMDLSGRRQTSHGKDRVSVCVSFNPRLDLTTRVVYFAQ